MINKKKDFEEMKIFKKTHWLLSALALITMTFGCDHLLDVEPDSQISTDQFWKTEADAESGVAAIYDAMQSAYSGRYFIWGEMRSDNWQGSGNPNAAAQELLMDNLSDQLASITDWTDHYTMIHAANRAIENLPNVNGDVDRFLGQAYALRSFAYFDAARAWGSVPLYLKSINSFEDLELLPKTPGSIIMDSVVVPDMLRAEELLLNRRDRFLFSLSSVYCLQAEVYMHLKEYTLAKEALDKLEDLGEFSLVTDLQAFHALFRNEPESQGLSATEQETGPELIFSLRYTFAEDAGESEVWNFFWPGVPNYKISQALEEKWVETFPTDSISWHAKYPDFIPSFINPEDGSRIYGDIQRYLQLIESSKVIGDRRYAKYNRTNHANNLDDTDLVIYRYAGMLLLKAEAEVHEGNPQEAVDLFNRIRDARDLPRIALTDFQSSDELIDVILQERQFELLAEGKRWWDLIRTDKAVEVMGPINGQTEATLHFPIFFEHLSTNPLLFQTDGYQ